MDRRGGEGVDRRGGEGRTFAIPYSDSRNNEVVVSVYVRKEQANNTYVS